MLATTIKMGKRGTIVLPAKLRKQFRLTDGSILITEEKDGGINLRPAYMYEPELWSDMERAYVILSGCVTKGEWDENVADVIKLGLDPRHIQGLSPDHRDTLPSDEEWNVTLNGPQEKLIA